MGQLLNRRELILSGGSAALLCTWKASPASALDLGSVFGTVLGAVGVGLFPGAAAALGGFELVRLLGNAADLAGSAGDLVKQTQQLEAHFDSVLSQVSVTLATVQSFVQDCDKTLHDIEDLIHQLPNTISAAFDKAAATTAFARLRADSANMAGYLQSKGSIIANKAQIQSLSEKMVTEISTIDALAPNMFQSMMQTVPGLATWVQGYTAYNLLAPGDSRATNPWDHQAVSQIALPKIKVVLQAVQQQQAAMGDLDSQLPLDPGILYTFNGSSFAKANHPFATQYGPGQINNGYYYAIWPDGVTPVLPPNMPFSPGAPKPVFIGLPQPGDLCYLAAAPSSPRLWWELPAPNIPLGTFVGAEVSAAQQVAVVYPRLMSQTLRSASSLNQLTQGWEVFQRAVKTNLTVDDNTKATWKQLPALKT